MHRKKFHIPIGKNRKIENVLVVPNTILELTNGAFIELLTRLIRCHHTRVAELGNENFRQARIYNFRVKCVVFARNRKFAKLTQ